MLIGIAVEKRRAGPSASVRRVNVSSSRDSRAERHVELAAATSPARACRARRRVNGRRLTRIVPTPSGVSGGQRWRDCMLRTIAMCRRGSVDADRVAAPRPRASSSDTSRPGRSRKYQRETLSRPSSVRWPQKRRPGLDGVERVLAEHERAGGGRRPGVDQRDLDRPEALRRPRDEAARFVVDEAHARIAVEMAGEVAEAAVDRAR